jgi:hypothetical protein
MWNQSDRLSTPQGTTSKLTGPFVVFSQGQSRSKVQKPPIPEIVTPDRFNGVQPYGVGHRGKPTEPNGNDDQLGRQPADFAC